MRTLYSALLLTAALALIVAAAPVHAADAPQPAADSGQATNQTSSQWIDQLSHDVIAVLADKSLSSHQKQLKIQEIAFVNIDFPTISRLTLGRHWRELNDQQRQEFMREYRAHLSNTYRRMIDNYSGETVKVVGERDEGRGDRTVLTKVVDPTNPSNEIKADYRVRKEKDHWKIIDITVEGVSLASNFRSQFDEIMNNGGFDKLMQLLKDKNAEAAKEGGMNADEAGKAPASQPSR